MTRTNLARCADGSWFTGFMVAVAFWAGLNTAAPAQVPATTGPDIIQDVTGSGRATSDEAGAAEGTPESVPSETPPAETATPETGTPEIGTPEPDAAVPAAEKAASPTERPAQGDVSSQERAKAGEPGDGETGASAVNSQPAPAASVKTEQAQAPARPAFVVGSWAGAYGQAQSEAVIEPIAREFDYAIERRTPNEGAVAFDGFDVVELGQEQMLAACRDARVLRISDWPKEAGDQGFAPNGATDRDFLVPAGPNGCGLPSFAWSSILVVNANAMKALAKRRYREPGTIRSLVDVRRYPGKRALIRGPRRLLEMLLLADGVGREDVYQVLATRDGEDRAFALLDGLKEDIEWVSGPRAAFAALDEGRVTMAMTFSGRAFRRLIASELRPIWDGHVIDYASWAVPKSTARGAQAVAFIQAALKPERMAAQARIWPYGPMRRSAVTLARRHALLGTELDVYLPTSELRFEQGIVLNAQFWAENGERLQTRFDDWMNGVPLGIRVPPPRKAPPAPLPPPPRLRSGG